MQRILDFRFLVDFFDIFEAAVCIEINSKPPLYALAGDKLTQDRRGKTHTASINGVGQYILGTTLVPALIFIGGDMEIDSNGVQG